MILPAEYPCPRCGTVVKLTGSVSVRGKVTTKEELEQIARIMAGMACGCDRRKTKHETL